MEKSACSHITLFVGRNTIKNGNTIKCYDQENTAYTGGHSKGIVLVICCSYNKLPQSLVA